jgi:hypothetical protein
MLGVADRHDDNQRGRVSSQEILADTEQMQRKNVGLRVASGEEWLREHV